MDGTVIDVIPHTTIPGLELELRAHDGSFAKDDLYACLFEYGYLEAVIKLHDKVSWAVMIGQYATNAAPRVNNGVCDNLMLFPFESLEGVGVDYVLGTFKFWGICKDLRTGDMYPRTVDLPY